MAESDRAGWTQAGGGAQRTGRTRRSPRLSGAAIRRCVLPGSLQAGVVFAGPGTLIAADMAGNVGVFASGGETLWQRRLGAGVLSTPAVDVASGRLHVGTLGGGVLALSLKDGSTLWRRDLPSRRDPRIAADLLLVPGSGGLVVSSWGGRFNWLDPATGETLSSWDAGIAPQSAAAATEGGEVYLVRVRSGEGASLVLGRRGNEERELIRAPENARGAQRTVATAGPLVDVDSDTVFWVANGDRRALLRAWSRGEERERWVLELEAVVMATPALRADGGLVVTDMAGKVVGVSRKGEVEWRYASGCEYILAGAVCDAAGWSYVADPVGGLHRIDGVGRGEAIFRASRSFQSRPAFAENGDLVVPCTDGIAYGFSGAEG